MWGTQSGNTITGQGAGSPGQTRHPYPQEEDAIHTVTWSPRLPGGGAAATPGKARAPGMGGLASCRGHSLHHYFSSFRVRLGKGGFSAGEAGGTGVERRGKGG
jgi:hypothetical protein